MKKEMISYMAGFFDGEGSICILKRQRKYKNICIEHILSVAIGQKDGATMDWIVDNFGGHLHKVKRDGSYYWIVTNTAALKFLKIIIPFLKYKKPQAELAIKFYDDRSTDKMYRMNDKELARREDIREQIKLLHKTIIKSQYAGSTTKRENALTGDVIV